MKLYHHPLSGHAHRARLMLSLAGLPHELIEVDLAAGAHRQPSFLRLNAFGEIPVLVDGEAVIADSNAILVYIARRIGPSPWLPDEPLQEAEVQRWLSAAAGKVAFGVAAARLVALFGAPFDPAEVIARGEATLEVIEGTLAARDWIAGTGAPTIADVALYGYVARAPEGKVSLAGRPRIGAWLGRIEALPGFVPFARTPAGAAA